MKKYLIVLLLLPLFMCNRYAKDGEGSWAPVVNKAWFNFSSEGGIDTLSIKTEFSLVNIYDDKSMLDDSNGMPSHERPTFVKDGVVVAKFEFEGNTIVKMDFIDWCIITRLKDKKGQLTSDFKIEVLPNTDKHFASLVLLGDKNTTAIEITQNK